MLCAEQDGHCQSRTFSDSSSNVCPQQEQVLGAGKPLINFDQVFTLLSGFVFELLDQA